ncbi:PTS sugar transporter subunit IIA [Vibrio spartinae]|uniref:Heat-responsive suppressor HrsA n=1 Tax=Vibrio spartinae TaxID=1918945 RepID=A0A1N6M1J9_9VIBR|nr:PTS sugar transporter subunit IIA [Vibrio spartinae]QMV15441.1 Putative PTS system EIIABC component [Vibrio spartinae]SIO93309.1 Heat-responsive suppressor HrsA [Vibrio spartinae]
MLSKLFKGLKGGESRPIFDATHVLIDESSKTRDEALQFIARELFNRNYITHQDKFLVDLIAREDTDSTGFKDGIATPHAKSKQVKSAGIWVVRFSNPIQWETMDNSDVQTVIALSIPNKGSEDVMKSLIAISKANMKAEFRDIVKNGENNTVVSEIENVLKEGI